MIDRGRAMTALSIFAAGFALGAVSVIVAALLAGVTNERRQVYRP